MFATKAKETIITTTDATTGTYEGRTAAEWRAMAIRNRRESAESFERCDTDGFLTQWAHDVTAREYEAKAELAENNGYWDFLALFDLEGNRIYAENVDGTYGPVWRVFDPETKDTIRWITDSSARKASTREANNAKKGFRFGRVRAQAVCRQARGWSGGTYFAPRDRYMIDAEVVTTHVALEDW
jgi:hypothetical protein